MTPLVQKCVSINSPYDSEVLNIILKLIKVKFY